MQPEVIFKSIEFGSSDFRKECELRHQVLRTSIGLSLYDEDLSGETHQRHFGLFDPAGNLLACAIAVVLSPTTAKIRQMAVSAACQQQGYGRRIMRGIEERLAAGGHVHVCLNARLTASGFYEKLGYHKAGGEFTEVGIPHILMEKHLTL